MAIYFVSDTHLGLDLGKKEPLEREKFLVRFLSSISEDCRELFLVGDIFDFWFEWKRVVPRGYVRLLAQLASMVDRGVKIHFLTGNHDLWVDDYFTREIGITIHTEPQIIERQGRRLFIAHGDIFYQHKMVGRILSALFRSRVTRAIARRLILPDAMMRFGLGWSRSNREKHELRPHVFGKENDFLVKFAKNYLHSTDREIDYFVFGHEHTPVIYPIDDRAQVVILGEWIDNPIYGKLNDGLFTLEKVL